jgi:hypothetical protein
MSRGLRNYSVTPNTSDYAVTFTVSDIATSVTFHNAGTGYMRMKIKSQVDEDSSATYYTLLAGQKEAVDGRILAGETLQFLAENSSERLELQVIEGLNT